MAGGNGRWCCCAGCWVFLDDFDRAASTDVTSNWHEEVGDWETLGDSIEGWLHELAGTTPGTDGTADAAIYGTRPVPADSTGEMQVNVSILNPVYTPANDVFKIYLGCTDEHGAGGSWVSFTYTGVNTWTVTLSTGEYKTQVWIPVLEGVFPVVACIDSDGFLMGSVASSGDEFPWNDGDATTSGCYYGLGHDNPDTGAEFDDFRVSELRTATLQCANCFCHCAENNLEKVLCGTIAGADRADCMDGHKVDFTWEWNSGNQRWVSEVLTIGANSFKWIFECEAYDPDDPFGGFKLYLFPGASPNYKTCCSANTGGCDAVATPNPTLSECDGDAGLSLVYGPFKFSRGELTCTACYDFFSGPDEGLWYMTISEGACP
jgi:hypothetical protein